MASSKKSKAKVSSKDLKRARDARYRAKLKGEKLAGQVAESKDQKRQIKDLREQLARRDALAANLEDERAPLDLDHFVESFSAGNGKTLDAGTMSRSKRQEYNQLQGQFADFLANPSAFDDGAIRKLARYGAGLTEDDSRFVKRRFARIVSIQAAREQLFLRNFVARSTELFKDKVQASGYSLQRPRAKADRILTLHVSDTHIGARLDPKEFPRGSDAISEARRLGMLTAETLDYKPQYRNRTTLHLLLNGDLIAGLLGHSNAREEDTLTEQFTRCLHMLVQMVTNLAAGFPRVVVFCQAGNHGRNILVHPGRATAAKHDSYEHMIYVALQVACRSLKNTTFEIPTTPYCAIPLFSQWGLMTHGDTLINAGNPASSVNVKAIVTQINGINASGALGHHFDVIYTGHVHTAMSLYFPGGTLLVNGAATPPNGHAISLGFFDACAQWLVESVEGYPVGDMRLLRLDKSVDNDATYERFVKPVLLAA